MSRVRGGLAAQVALAGTAAATTWVAMWSWRGFSVVPGRYLGPLFVLGVVIGGTGALARWWRFPAVAVVALQAVVSGMVASSMLCGSPVPVGSAYTRLTDAFSAAVDSANKYASPIPAHAPGVHPLLIVGGLLCLLMVDVLACTMRRVPLAGLPLLTIYSIPVSLLGGGVSWWVFAFTAAGFMTLLFLQESEQLARWGRPLGQDAAAADPSAFGVRTGAIRTSAGTIGGVATALAIVVPLAVPTLDFHLFDIGKGRGGDSDIRIENPMTDLVRDLNRGDDVPLLRVRTDDPDPAYLRIAVLNRFSDNEWSSGDRDVPANNLPDGDMPDLVGVATTLNRTYHRYAVDVDDGFRSFWLPTQAPITRIEADGDWRYDASTMDFLASDKNLTTAGMSYSMTGVKLDIEAAALARATSSSGLVSRDYTELPPGMPTIVRQLANEVTREAPSRYEKAVALQTWFRETGHFTYDLHAARGNGTDELVAFLTEGDGGRTGYCEQFASAMAVMARTLGIPARVAVGFLEPDRIGRGTYEYSAYDLHAWPELFFAGAGWVRFEPTPAGRAPSVPSYTTQEVPVVNPTGGPTDAPSISDEPSRGGSITSEPKESAAGADKAKQDPGFPWLPVLGGSGGLLVAGLLLLLPRAVRRRRRERRLTGDPEAAWAELRDTAVDLGVPWPESRSPRETRALLVEHVGTPADRGTPERPRHGAGVAPGAVRCLDRLVHALEELRYARSSEPVASLADDTEACLAALEGGASRSARRRAEWWPRSVVSRAPGQLRAEGERPVQARHGGVVDHVG